MKKVGNRFFTDVSKYCTHDDIFYKTIQCNLLKSEVNNTYKSLFNTPHSFFIKNNIYKFNAYIYSKILLLSFSTLLDENNIKHKYNIYDDYPIIKIGSFKFTILDSGINDIVSLIDINFFKNNPQLFDCDYFIFVKLNNSNSLINLNTSPNNLMNFNYIEDIILNKNIVTNIIGFLDKDTLESFLINKYIIPPKTILDNKTCITNANYYIYNSNLKSISVLLDTFKNSFENVSIYDSNTILNTTNSIMIDSCIVTIPHNDNNLNTSNNYCLDLNLLNYNINKNDLVHKNIDNIINNKVNENDLKNENTSFLKKLFIYSKKY